MTDKSLAALGAKEAWVFDLDNTLYPAACDLFAQIDSRITQYVAQFLSVHETAARALQKKYYAEHGTTLKGMMANHAMSPEAFLDFVHDIDHSSLPVCERLREAIDALPGRKYVFTNGSRGHAEQVTRKMELHDLFDGMFGIEDANYEPKPHQTSFDRFIATYGVQPHQSAFFEDLSRNLAPAHAMGFTTVLVHSEHDWSHEPEAVRPAAAGDFIAAHVDHVTGDLTGFLETLASG